MSFLLALPAKRNGIPRQAGQRRGASPHRDDVIALLYADEQGGEECPTLREHRCLKQITHRDHTRMASKPTLYNYSIDNYNSFLFPSRTIISKDSTKM